MTRVYNEQIDISESSVRNFYDARAARYMDLGKRSVLLGDHSPEIAESIDRFEREVILPKLIATPVGRVLDIGCGIGRWAQKLAPYADYYLGTDLSPKMIEQARNNVSSDRAEFKCLSARDTVFGNVGKFHTVILSEVLMYINDDILEDIFSRIDTIMERDCKVYLCETVGLSGRLTLNEHLSEALKANYSVIYRERNDYITYMEKLGLKIKEEALFDCTHVKGETARWWAVWER